jgi:hypothetical protein
VSGLLERQQDAAAMMALVRDEVSKHGDDARLEIPDDHGASEEHW